MPEQTPAPQGGNQITFKELFRTLGPGIMAASAAIGGSHLVSSTQAGALYGFALVLFILLINFIKYPFFRAGPTWTLATGEGLLDGYAKLGKGWVWLAWFLMAYGGFTSTAACAVFAAGILHYMIPALPMWACSILVMASCLGVIMLGRFKLLNQVSKALVALLSFVTVMAVLVLLFSARPDGVTYLAAASTRPEVSPWTMAGLGFIVMLMGWMPCPLDITLIQSAWVKRQKVSQNVTVKGGFFDFNTGFIVTALLAAVFCVLGALVMFGSYEKPIMQGGGFTTQLIDLYAQSIGKWSIPFMSVMAFACIWGSAVTVMDGYARVCGIAQCYLKGKPEADYRPGMTFWLLFEFVAGLALIFFFKNEMIALLKFAMICAFCTTPILAAINFRLMTGNYLPKEWRYGQVMKVWGIAGLIFLFGFLGVFLWWFF